jgi:aminoglycoside 3-N-acetyltransferase
MGAITEKFRQREGSHRSIHPTHSVAACGPGAEDLVVGHHSATTPFGAGTPFAGLIERDAYQVWFGCGVRAFTMYHAFECLRPSFPLDIFADRSYEVDCIDWDGRRITVSTLVHDPAISRYRIDANPPVAERWRSLLIDCGAMTPVPLGRGEVLAIRLQSLVTELDRLIAEGITIYDLSLPVATCD